MSNEPKEIYASIGTRGGQLSVVCSTTRNEKSDIEFVHHSLVEELRKENERLKKEVDEWVAKLWEAAK